MRPITHFFQENDIDLIRKIFPLLAAAAILGGEARAQHEYAEI